MPWRDDPSPYHVVVSEIMLQQTQVSRVLVKFPSFIKRFPNWKALAKASTAEVLREWSGLGYNRRALYLKRIAEQITTNGKTNRIANAEKLPRTYDELRKLPGIGPNTAGSILAFAYNIPRPFIETNIRSVYIHFFFKDTKKKVSDAELLPLIEKTLDQKNPREWYWALMDYGSYLKSQIPNPSRRSAHHVKQSPFAGSNRELRSKILRRVMKAPVSRKVIFEHFSQLKWPEENIVKNLKDLTREGFLVESRGTYRVI